MLKAGRSGGFAGLRGRRRTLGGRSRRALLALLELLFLLPFLLELLLALLIFEVGLCQIAFSLLGVDAAIESDDRRLPSRAGRIRPPLVNNTRTAMAPTTTLTAARRFLPIAVVALLAACGSAPTKSPSGGTGAAPPSSSTRYYKDDGPGESPPPNLDAIPEAVPKTEPLHRFANRPYTVLGRDYIPATTLRPYRERGIASWYGKKFHGEKTSTGDTYDMYAMTAAHPTLPLPS